VDCLLATKSEGVGLIVRAVSFQDFEPMWSQITNVTDGQTDRRHAIPRPRICTKVHCAVKIQVRLANPSFLCIDFLPTLPQRNDIDFLVDCAMSLSRMSMLWVIDKVDVGRDGVSETVYAPVDIILMMNRPDITSTHGSAWLKLQDLINDRKGRKWLNEKIALRCFQPYRRVIIQLWRERQKGSARSL